MLITLLIIHLILFQRTEAQKYYYEEQRPTLHDVVIAYLCAPLLSVNHSVLIHLATYFLNSFISLFFSTSTPGWTWKTRLKTNFHQQVL